MQQLLHQNNNEMIQQCETTRRSAIQPQQKRAPFLGTV